jgi:hypothetical protein
LFVNTSPTSFGARQSSRVIVQRLITPERVVAIENDQNA